jgi:T5SS/PEP-CTERM-associated repeat protein
MNMAGGTLKIKGSLIVGNVDMLGAPGWAAFSQSDGSITAAAMSVASSTEQPSRYTISGGTLSITSDLRVGEHTQFIPFVGYADPVSPAIFKVAGTSMVTAGTVEISPLGQLQMQGGTLQLNKLVFASGTASLSFADGTLEFIKPNAGISIANGGNSTFAWGSVVGTGTPTLKVTNTTADLGSLDLNVAFAGNGALLVGPNSTLHARSTTLGQGTNVQVFFVNTLVPGFGKATINGGTFINDAGLNVGMRGNGVLDIVNGGTVQSASGQMGATNDGSDAWGRNLVHIDGNPSKLTISGGLAVGGSQTAPGVGSDLVLSSGGSAVVGGTLKVWNNSTVQLFAGSHLDASSLVMDGGLVKVQDSTATVGTLSLMPASKLVVNGSPSTQLVVNGPADIQAGAHVENDQFIVFNGKAQISSGATYAGYGAKVYTGGLAITGPQPTVVSDSGWASFAPTNVFEVELGNGVWDGLAVAGPFFLNGTLKLLSWQGYQGKAGDAFTVMASNYFAGSFNGVDTGGFTLAPGLAWDFSLLNSNGVIGIVADLAPPAVPEPSAAWLMLGGLVGVCAVKRRSAT